MALPPPLQKQPAAPQQFADCHSDRRCRRSRERPSKLHRLLSTAAGRAMSWPLDVVPATRTLSATTTAIGRYRPGEIRRCMRCLQHLGMSESLAASRRSQAARDGASLIPSRAVRIMCDSAPRREAGRGVFSCRGEKGTAISGGTTRQTSDRRVMASHARPRGREQGADGPRGEGDVLAAPRG